MKTLKITTHWTPGEAACIYEMLDLFQTAIWEAYGNDITEFYMEIAKAQALHEETFIDDGSH
ncbi:hypothetical protein [Arsukibacterium sp.]|uniref:hypothetical protein n=1 Tax=Arsukibacterium sp. TaxID=1977258 RepID=UPI002FD96E46